MICVLLSYKTDPQLQFDDSSYCIHYAQKWLQELIELNPQYASPFHFTDAEMGTSLYLFWKCKRNLNADNLIEVRDLAVNYLEKSRQMCTSGKEYYKNLQSMYYLYDDFNDNQIHLNHALQMASQKLVDLYLDDMKNNN